MALRRMNNFYGCSAIVMAFRQPALEEIKRLWVLMREEAGRRMAELNDLAQLLDQSNGYKNYRMAWEQAHRDQGPCLPNLMDTLSTLINLKEVLKTPRPEHKHLVNFNLYLQMHKSIEVFLRGTGQRRRYSSLLQETGGRRPDGPLIRKELLRRLAHPVAKAKLKGLAEIASKQAVSIKYEAAID